MGGWLSPSRLQDAPASNRCEPKPRRNVMTRGGRFRFIAAAGGVAFLLSARAVLGQQALPPLPKPDTPPPVPPILQNYKPVTADRLKQPDDGDWLMYRRTYDSWGYSPLSQITPDNAGRLKPVWTFADRPDRRPPGAADGQ